MKKKSSIFTTLAKLLFCGLLLTWIFYSIFVSEAQIAVRNEGSQWNALTRGEQWHYAWTHGPNGLWQTLNQVPIISLVLSVLLMGTTILLGTWRWKIVLKVVGLDLSFGRALEISMISHFFNSFLLGSSGGDLIKAYYAARETHHQKPEAVVTVLIDRIIGLFSMLVFACMMLIPNLGLLQEHKRLAFFSWITAVMSAGIASVLVIAFWGGISKRVPRARDWLRHLPWGHQIDRALDACRALGKHPLFLIKTLMISLVLTAVCVAQFATLAQGMGMQISTTTLALVVPVIICFAAIPITPSGLGVRENLFVYLLAVNQFNVSATAALLLSLLAYAGSLFWSIAGGLVYVSVKDRQHLDEITRAEAEEAP